MILHVTLVLGAMFLLLGLYLPHFNVNTLIITKIIAFLIGFFLSGSMLSLPAMESEAKAGSPR